MMKLMRRRVAGRGPQGREGDSSPDELTVFTKPGCPWCMAVTGYLLNEGYEFTEVDVLAKEGRLEEVRELTGQALVPAVRWRDRVQGNCTVGELKRLLQDWDIRPW